MHYGTNRANIGLKSTRLNISSRLQKKIGEQTDNKHCLRGNWISTPFSSPPFSPPLNCSGGLDTFDVARIAFDTAP